MSLVLPSIVPAQMSGNQRAENLTPAFPRWQSSHVSEVSRHKATNSGNRRRWTIRTLQRERRKNRPPDWLPLLFLKRALISVPWSLIEGTKMEVKLRGLRISDKYFFCIRVTRFSKTSSRLRKRGKLKETGSFYTFKFYIFIFHNNKFPCCVCAQLAFKRLEYSLTSLYHPWVPSR